MALPFLSSWKSKSRGRDEVIVIDLGMRVTKAGWFKKEGNDHVLAGFTLFEALQAEKRLATESLAEHLRAVVKALNASTDQAIIVVGPEDSRLYHTDVPAIGLNELRRMLRQNSRAFLQEDLPGHLFDCHLIPNYQPSKVPEPVPATGEGGEAEIKEEIEKPAPVPVATSGGRNPTRVRGMVAAMKATVVEGIREAATAAGLSVQSITIGQVAVCNAFRIMPSVSHKEVVALVDIGFKTSTISIVMNGVLMLSRVVNIGADAFTSGLAETLNITYSVAEGIKQVMPEKVQSKLQGLLSPLAQELRASIDFFEHQFEKPVSEVLVSGGTARSKLAVQLLESETVIPCRSWNPTTNLKVLVAGEHAMELAKDASQMVVAVGTAVSWFDSDLPHLNLLAEELADFEARRRDPVRRGIWVAGAAFALMFIWVAVLGFKFWRLDRQLKQHEAERAAVQKKSEAATAFSRQAFQVEKRLANLQQITTNRFQWASPLDALQFCAVTNVQFNLLKIERTLDITPGAAAVTNQTGQITTPARPPTGVEKVTLSLQAKDFGDAREEFIRQIESQEYFLRQLKAGERTRLIQQSPLQVDPLNVNVSYRLFELECYYADRQFRGDVGP